MWGCLCIHRKHVRTRVTGRGDEGDLKVGAWSQSPSKSDTRGPVTNALEGTEFRDFLVPNGHRKAEWGSTACTNPVSRMYGPEFMRFAGEREEHTQFVVVAATPLPALAGFTFGHSQAMRFGGRLPPQLLWEGWAPGERVPDRQVAGGAAWWCAAAVVCGGESTSSMPRPPGARPARPAEGRGRRGLVDEEQGRIGTKKMEGVGPPSPNPPFLPPLPMQVEA